MAAVVRRYSRISSSFTKNVLNPYMPRIGYAFLHRCFPLYGTKGIEIKMPSLSPTMTEGTIITWLKKEGDKIAPGEVLCEVQTDKAVVGFEMEEEGVLAKILMPSDSKDVKIGTLIALMVEEGQDWKDVEIPESSSISTSAPDAPSSPDTTVSTTPTPTKHGAIGPAVRALLSQYGLNSDQIQASGPHNTLLKGDVLSYVAAHNLKPHSGDLPATGEQLPRPVSRVPSTKPAFTDIPLTNMRKVIAKRLTESKTTVPHAYMVVDSNISSLIEIRRRFKDEGISVSVNDMMIKAVATALQAVPQANVTWQNNAIQYQPTIDISVAVATESGLITPIIKNANQLGIPEISSTMKELAARAKIGKLQPHEFQGGTFSISNLGMLGVNEFSAIINPPQAAILAVGCSRFVPIGKKTFKTMMKSTLSYDARAVSEPTAAEFLEVLRLYLENPSTLIAGSTALLQRQALSS